MTTNSPQSSPKRRIIKAVFSRRMLSAGLMGFSAGLPLLLTTTVLQAWMKDVGVDLILIGLMSLVGLPYTIKFLWSPLLDRYTLPFFGRRRAWLLLAQVGLIASIAGLGQSNPASYPLMTAALAMLVAFLSASQDIVIDAYRREDLADEEQGLGASFYVNGYRLGMLLASGGGLILADHIPFSSVYSIMAGFVGLGLITTLLSPEPPAPAGIPHTLREAVIEPFKEYFSRPGAIMILAFILCYKLGDQMAAAMTTPFYLDIGFTKTDIGAVVKLFGFWATVAGGLLGGMLMIPLGINQSLWIFGLLMAVSTLGFAVLAQIGPSLWALAIVIALENLTGGMGTAAYVAFLASLTDRRFTATQFALLTSLMGVPRVLAAAPTGYLAKSLGWTAYFLICTFMAIPGLILLFKFTPWRPQPSK